MKQTITVYHGTNQVFTEFDFSKAGLSTSDICNTSTYGAFFTENITYARDYAKYATYNGGQEVILQAEIHIQYPLEITEAELAELENPEEYKQFIIDDGYDGLIIYTTHGEIEYCCFYPEQIKSLTCLTDVMPT
jgi:hypothetical protein